MLFKLEKSVPEVYTNQSRDFQLICRVIDLYLCQQLEKINRITAGADVDKFDSRLLPLLANKQGFITSLNIPSRVLRNICKVFPFCIKRKGTKEAIEVAVIAVLSADQEVTLVEVNTNDWKLSHSVDIITDASSNSIEYIEELLRFLMPTGFSYTITTSASRDLLLLDKVYINNAGTVRIDVLKNSWMRQIRPSPAEDSGSSIKGSDTLKTYSSRVGYIAIRPAIENNDGGDVVRSWSLQPHENITLGGSVTTPTSSS